MKSEACWREVVAEVHRLEGTMDARFEAVDARLGAMDIRMEAMNGTFKTHLGMMEEKLVLYRREWDRE